MPVYKEQLAWAAGFFDGEGSAQYHYRKNKRHRAISLTVQQVNRRPLEKFAAIVGVGKIYGPYERNIHNASAISAWKVSTLRDVEYVYELLKPWLSEPKKLQIEDCIRRYYETEVRAYANSQGSGRLSVR